MRIERTILTALWLLGVIVPASAQEIQPDITSVEVTVTVDPGVIKGPVKPMNAVNNGPAWDSPQQKADFRILDIPFSRTHDARGYYGEQVVDISSIFPDWSKNPDKESSYDFRETDLYIKTLI